MKRTCTPKSVALSWQQLLEEADLCADHAQSAASCGRFCAACGLILTASALCTRALESCHLRCAQNDGGNEVENAVVERLGFYQDEVDRLLEAALARRLDKTEDESYAA